MREFKWYEVTLRSSNLTHTAKVSAASKVQAVLAASRAARAAGLTDRTWKLVEVKEISNGQG